VSAVIGVTSASSLVYHLNESEGQSLCHRDIRPVNRSYVLAYGLTLCHQCARVQQARQDARAGGTA
jgi:hypothetical protein